MTDDNVQNLMLEQFRQLREEIAKLHSKMDMLDGRVTRGFADLQEEMDAMDGRLDGVTLMLGNFATNIVHLDARVGRLEPAVD